MSRKGVRSYVWTLNNYTEEEVNNIKGGSYPYIVYGEEVGESGTRHLQGFVYFKDAKTITAVAKLPGWKRTHLEEAEKPLSAIDYCKKGEQTHEEWARAGVKGETYGRNAVVYEAGVFKQGKRSDLDEVYDAVKSGKSVEDVAWETPEVYQKAFKSLEKLEDLRLRKTYRTEMTKGIWIYGKTGMGKSEYAYQGYGAGDIYSYPYDGNWWDGYRQQPLVVIDEFRGQIPFNELLRMVDKHPNYCVRRRNREPMPFCSKQVTVTSCMPPWGVFKNLDAEDSMRQLVRRFTVYEITDDGLMEIDYASV